MLPVHGVACMHAAYLADTHLVPLLPQAAACVQPTCLSSLVVQHDATAYLACLRQSHAKQCKTAWLRCSHEVNHISSKVPAQLNVGARLFCFLFKLTTHGQNTLGDRHERVICLHADVAVGIRLNLDDCCITMHTCAAPGCTPRGL